MPIDHRYDHDGKVYVDVTARFHVEGRLINRNQIPLTIEPMSFVWTDGNEYEITKVIDIQRAASLRAGGAGLRYTVRIGRHERYIWLEENDRWFMEAKEG